jgi:hypothetical protein
MHASGAQLRDLAALYDASHLRPVIDTTYPFDQTLQALAYVEQGGANGNAVVASTENRRWRSASSGRPGRPPRSRSRIFLRTW